MATIINFQDAFEMPLNLQTLEAFRGWTHGPQFPECGRIDYVEGRIEVDMSPEDLFTHGTPKSDIHAALHRVVRKKKLGHLFVDRTRVASVPADLSAEPDILFVSRESIKSGRVRLIPKATGEPDRYVELDGAVDLVVEIVSDSSETKDTKRLPGAYFKAGVREFWLVDVRGEVVTFQIHIRGKAVFELREEDPDGFRFSEVFDCRFRLDRARDEDGFWEYDLRVGE